MKHISRRELLKIAAGTVALSTMGPLACTSLRGGGASSAAAKHPNILFIAVDDLRPQLGCYGQPQMITPNIDALAHEGVVFMHNYCQYAVCGPSRDSILTGLRPDTNGTTDNVHNFRQNLPNWVTIPEHFARHGYQTVKTGKISHVNRDDKAFQRIMYEFSQPGVSLYNSPANKSDMLKNMDVIHEKELAGEKLTDHERYVMMIGPHYEWSDAPDNHYSDGAMADLATEEMKKMKTRTAPTFLAVGFHRPHLPFNCPKKYWDLYDSSHFKMASNNFYPKDVPPVAMMKYDELGDYKNAPKKDKLTEEQGRRMMHGYYACVSYVDAQVGRLLKGLEENGLADNTIVILWGDHGWHLGEHSLWGKDTNFEEATRAPMILRVPGIQGGRRVDALTEFVDIYPSLSELAGLPIPKNLEGRSFVPLMRRPDRPWKNAAFSQIRRGTFMGHSIRTERYRLTRWIDEKNGKLMGIELYDHVTDPGENENISTHPECAQTVKELTARLEAGWRKAAPPRLDWLF